jgi:hypothetical protein
MRISLVSASIIALGWAADMSIWEIDASCQPHLDALQAAYDDAAAMVQKTIQDLELIKTPRPSPGKTKSAFAEFKKWNRVFRAVTLFFGFGPDTNGHSPTESHYSNVRCKW